MVVRVVATIIFILSMSGCESTYYSAMESVGLHKRDILVDRINDVKEAQVDVKEQFSSALDRFTHELNFNGGELEKTYNLISDEYEQSKSEADRLSARIDKVDDVAQALFDEWGEELNQYTSASLRRESAAQLKDTQRRYQSMLTAMRATEKKMFPILDTLRDQTLYLKHNLNARAISSLKGEFGSLRRDITLLIKDMEKSIAETDRFMVTLQP